MNETTHRLTSAVVGALVLLVLGGGCSPEDAAPRSRLVVIGVDSGSWKLFDPWIEAGEMPRLRALCDRGYTAELSTVEPLISPPNWTSIATGMRPEHHGITSFFADRRSVRAPAVWERLAAGGLRVGVYDYLVTWPPRALPGGAVIPGWLRRDDRVDPPDLAERLGKRPYTYGVTDMGGLDEVTGIVDRELREKAGDFNLLMRSLDLDAGFVTFYAFDVMSHRFFHTYAPEAFEPRIRVEPRYEGILEKTARRLDAAVGEITAALDEDAHVVLVSDHGSAPDVAVHRMWGYDAAFFLSGAGLTEDDGVASVNSFIFTAFKVEDGPEEDRDDAMRRLEAFVRDVRSASGDPLLEVRTFRDPERTMAEAEPWQAEVMEPHLPAYGFLFVSVVPEVVGSLWPDGEVVAGGGRLSIREVVAANDFTGGHDPTGFFLAAGPAVARGAPRGRLSVVDVAPLLLYLAGQAVPDGFDGRLAEEVLDPDYLARHPVRRVAVSDALLLPPEEVDPDDAESEEIRRRLRALGYVR